MNKSVLFFLAVVSLLLIVNQPRAEAGCTCDAWCRGRGCRGGICGDGHTCICRGCHRGKRDLEEAADSNDASTVMERTDWEKDADH